MPSLDRARRCLPQPHERSTAPEDSPMLTALVLLFAVAALSGQGTVRLQPIPVRVAPRAR